MRKDFDTAAAQTGSRVECSACGRSWYPSLMAECPLRGTHICMFCCRSCGRARQEGGQQWCGERGGRKKRKEAAT